jgi:hypothetical protein
MRLPRFDMFKASMRITKSDAIRKIPPILDIRFQALQLWIRIIPFIASARTLLGSILRPIETSGMFSSWDRMERIIAILPILNAQPAHWLELHLSHRFRIRGSAFSSS